MGHHVVDVRLAQIDPAHVELLRALHQDPQEHPSDAPKAIDADFNCHTPKPLFILNLLPQKGPALF